MIVLRVHVCSVRYSGKVSILMHLVLALGCIAATVQSYQYLLQRLSRQRELHLHIHGENPRREMNDILRSDEGRYLHQPISPQKEAKNAIHRRLQQYMVAASVMAGTLQQKTLPSLAVDGNSSPIKSGAIGYEAAESAFSPMQALYTVPLLPQSALLNSLPIDNVLIGQIQAFLESFVQLINPSSRQKSQIFSSNSALWINLRINAQRAAGMAIYNQDSLKPVVFPSEPSELQALRIQQGEVYLEDLKQQLVRLVAASRKSYVGVSLRCVRNALNALYNLAYLQVPLTATSLSDNSDLSTDVDNRVDDITRKLAAVIPRLLGRASVKLKFQRPGPLKFVPGRYLRADVPDERFRYVQAEDGNSLDGSKASQFINIEGANDGIPSSEVTMVVDGINHPLTGGNFIDLCEKGFYENLPIGLRSIEFSTALQTDFLILGDYDKGYTDPLTGQQRRIPLEVYREDENRKRFTVTGAARNTPIFTKARPVLSFATVSFIHYFLFAYF